MSDKKQQKPSTALTVTTEVPDILQIIKEELATLTKVAETPFKTNGEFGGGFPNLIKTPEIKVETLIKAWASCKGQANAYADAQTDLGIPSAPVFTIAGFTQEEWKHDISLKISITTTDQRRKELEADLEEMKSFLSEQDRKAIVVKRILERRAK